MKSIHEEARDIPVFAEAEVLVAGGGLAGCAAALAAARAGAKTILVEQNGCLGGVATASMMGNIGNRYMVSGELQVVQGIAGEVADRLVAVGAANPDWRKHKAVAMDSERLKVVLIEMLEDAGVTTLTHSMAARPIVQDGAVTGAFFESKSGRQAILAANTVDCTGEADLAYRAGAEVREHRFSSSLLYKLTGVDIDKFVEFVCQAPDLFPDGCDWIKNCDEFASRWRQDGILFFGHHAGKSWQPLQDAADRSGFGEMRHCRGHHQRWWGPAENIDAFGMYTHRQDGSLYINTGYYCMDTVNVRDASASELHAQKLCYYSAEFLQKNIPGFENSRVEHIGTHLGMRGGRYIIGRTLFKRSDMYDAGKNVQYPDVIGMTPCQSTAKDSYPGCLGTMTEVPFGSCVPVNGPGRLLVGSGKSVYTEGGNYRLYRGMSGCMMYGQAAGAAAAVAAAENQPVAELPLLKIQQELLRQGVMLGAETRLRELGLTE